MKNISKIFLFAVLTIAVSACSTCKVTTDNQIKEIQFGRGGGFANQIEEYSLNRKGQLCKNGKIIGHASCEDVERIFIMADAIDTPIYEPDNFYWFIEVKGKATQKYLWGGSAKVDRSLKNLYNELNNLVK